MKKLAQDWKYGDGHAEVELLRYADAFTHKVLNFRDSISADYQLNSFQIRKFPGIRTHQRSSSIFFKTILYI